MNMALTCKETLDRIDAFALAYPDKWFVVEVKYSAGGDIAITECRAERGKAPKERDNAYGFTANFISYEEAKKFARSIAKELNIKTCI